MIRSAGALSLATAPLTQHRSPIDLVEILAMVDAAADAGFSGMSIWTAHHDWAVENGMSSEEYFDYHTQRGISIPAAEVILDWARSDSAVIADENTHVLDVAAGAGAASVIVATLEAEVPSLSEMAARLGMLCDLAAERGIGISCEFLPPTAIPDLATVAQLLEAVDRDNLGLVLDTWHWFLQPGGPDIPTLRSIPPERIDILQVNDAPAQLAGSWEEETMHGRLLPGEGVVDIQGLLDVLESMGAAPVLISEVFSTRLRSLGVAENARRQYAAASSVFKEHEASGTGSHGAT